MNEYESVSDVVLTNEHIRYMSKAGASDLFIDLLTFPKGAADVPRHSLEQEIKKYVFWGKLDETDPADFQHVGGHFFGAMWDGDLFHAWTRADLNNKALLLECFGQDEIIQSGVRDGKPLDYSRRMVAERAALM
ncbi:hypothetical protein HRTV-25_gp84 [Halorubrum tailed virus 25]|uniref:Uncharacterized protein n=1 Tax=Halorubrum tailed virus 25 TaxID=2878006 RepID=A0AAE8XXT3_9CAUD|nr:hypothetical protein M1M37_gp084 [Halorubrum tailed virus 25]UBF22665.1 hypothetical protein HRTV-25_gp84 [Halorubrum tailed virus 25]